ncbi:hypothetical protein [Cloacibacillus sp.]|uniref:type IV pilus modification PilV family protein n=1 Tax=Cloacibacillus sp. TaxID=2049023 RepID=UPI0025C501A9|nr:hypothetical protein [Cloacibacillus sp.]MCC8058776.1 hypothetical protein [Cloacibacillus sp.]
MRRSGSILTEILVAIIIFTVGLMAVAGTIMFSMRIIMNSAQTTLREQALFNDAENFLAERILENAGTPSSPAEFVENGSIVIGDKTLNYSLYRYRLNDKKGSEMYVIKRENS